MIKKYSQDLLYSYIEGFFPCFEFLKTRANDLSQIYISQNAVNSEAYKKIKSIVSEDKIIISDKPFSILKSKENTHCIAVFKKYDDKLERNLDHLVLVNPSDMGNMGNTFRTALAFNIKDVALIKPCCDMFNPKVIRASMGAIFKIRVETFDSFTSYLKNYQRVYYPFVLDCENYLSTVRFDSPCSLVFGNEATGLPKDLYNNNQIKIEQSNEVDSLNLTTSIAIALYQLSLQRKN